MVWFVSQPSSAIVLEASLYSAVVTGGVVFCFLRQTFLTSSRLVSSFLRVFLFEDYQ